MENFFIHNNKEQSSSAFYYAKSIIIDNNIPHIKNKIIFDIASNDGCWPYYMLKSGANFIYCNEPRDENVERLKKALTINYQLFQRDFFQIEIPKNTQTVFCLGFFYHTIRHYDIFERVTKLPNVKSFIIDTNINGQIHAVSEYFFETVEDRFDAVGDEVNYTEVLYANPSLKLMEYYARYFKWNISESSNMDLIHTNPKYHSGHRKCFVLTRE